MEFTSDRAARLIQDGALDEALGEINLGLLRDASDTTLLAMRAGLLVKMKRPTEAVRQWEQIRRVAPRVYSDGSRLMHAEALIAAEQFEDADSLLKSVHARVDDGGLRDKLIARLLTETGRLEHGAVRGPARAAAQIVDSNDALASEYRALMRNDPVAAAGLRFESLVIVTYGRTGSTLLQGILNVVDGIKVLGENEGAFLGLHQFYARLESLSKFKGSHAFPSSPFFGATSLDMANLLSQLRGLVTAYFGPFAAEPGVRCVGFKEVKVNQIADQAASYLEFLELVLPKPAFIFLWRDHDDVLKSGFWKHEDRDEAAATLATVEAEAARFAEGRNSCFTLDYSDLRPDAPRLCEMLEFLGGHFDQARITRVMEIPHSYNPEQTRIRQLFDDAKAPT